MKCTNTAYLLAIICCLRATTSAQVSHNTLEQKIKITNTSIRIDSLLNQLAHQSGLEFSFSTTKLSPAQTIAVTKRQQSLSQWLTLLHQQLQIQHKVVGNHIILFESSRIASPVRKGPRTNIKKQNTKTTAQKIHIHIDNSQQLPDTTNSQNAQKQVTPQQSSSLPVSNDQGPSDSGTAATPNKITFPENPALHPVNSLMVANKIAPNPYSPPGSVVDSTSTSSLINSQRSAAKRDTQAPDANEGPNRELIRFLLGYSKHGSGDMQGAVFGAAYEKYLSRAFSLSIDLRGSINYQKHSILVKNEQTGNTTDASIRFTTAGAQIGVMVHMSLVKSIRHEIQLGAGPFGRFQSASNGSDGYSVYTPQSTGQPIYLIGYDNKTPQNTFAMGGLLQLQYQYALSNKLVIGTAAGIQTDTNGDILTQMGITVGKRL